MNRLTELIAQARSAPRQVKLFLFTVLAYGIAVEGITAVLLNLYLLRLGYGTEFIGALNSIGLFVFALVSLPIGAVQRFSSRRMLQIGLVLSVIGMTGLPLAPYLPGSEPFWLVSFRITGMIGLSCYFVHQMPFAMEMTRPEWHDRILSTTIASFSLAAFLGSWIGGLLPEYLGRWLAIPLTDPWPFQLSMLGAMFIVIPAILATLAIPEPEADVGADGDQAVAQPVWSSLKAILGLVVVIIMIRAVQTGGVGVILTFSNVYFDDGLGLPTGRIGFISGLGRLLGVPVSLTTPWMMRRYGSYGLVFISMGLIGLL
ncbi:MAG: MFS transporter, partial [Chloroflexota bacterium]